MQNNLLSSVIFPIRKERRNNEPCLLLAVLLLRNLEQHQIPEGFVDANEHYADHIRRNGKLVDEWKELAGKSTAAGENFDSDKLMWNGKQLFDIPSDRETQEQRQAREAILKAEKKLHARKAKHFNNQSEWAHKHQRIVQQQEEVHRLNNNFIDAELSAREENIESRKRLVNGGKPLHQAMKTQSNVIGDAKRSRLTQRAAAPPAQPESSPSRDYRSRGKQARSASERQLDAEQLALHEDREVFDKEIAVENQKRIVYAAEKAMQAEKQFQYATVGIKENTHNWSVTKNFSASARKFREAAIALQSAVKRDPGCNNFEELQTRMIEAARICFDANQAYLDECRRKDSEIKKLKADEKREDSILTREEATFHRLDSQLKEKRARIYDLTKKLEGPGGSDTRGK